MLYYFKTIFNFLIDHFSVMLTWLQYIWYMKNKDPKKHPEFYSPFRLNYFNIRAIIFSPNTLDLIESINSLNYTYPEGEFTHLEEVLWWSCLDDQTEVLTQLIKNPNLNINIKDSKGLTPFYWAIRYGNLNVAFTFLINSDTLDLSIKHKNVNLLHELIEDQNVECENKYVIRNTFLSEKQLGIVIAIQKRNRTKLQLKIANLLLTKRPEFINEISRIGTPIHLSLEVENDVLSYFLIHHHAADLTIIHEDLSYLHYVANSKKQNLSLLKKILIQLKDDNLDEPENQQTLWNSALAYCNPFFAKIILEKFKKGLCKWDLLVFYDNYNVFHFLATKPDALALLKLLMEIKEFSPYLNPIYEAESPIEGQTPLNLAIVNKNKTIINYLMECDSVDKSMNSVDLLFNIAATYKDSCSLFNHSEFSSEANWVFTIFRFSIIKKIKEAKNLIELYQNYSIESVFLTLYEISEDKSEALLYAYKDYFCKKWWPYQNILENDFTQQGFDLAQIYITLSQLTKIYAIPKEITQLIFECFVKNTDFKHLFETPDDHHGIHEHQMAIHPLYKSFYNTRRVWEDKEKTMLKMISP